MCDGIKDPIGMKTMRMSVVGAVHNAMTGGFDERE